MTTAELWTYTLLSVLLVSLVSLVGLFALSQEPARLRRLQLYLVSLAAGSLLGGAFLHLLPEAVERLGTGLPFSLYLLGGFFGFFVLEKFLWHHHHGAGPEARTHPIVTMVLLGDGVHNLLDGMVIAAAYIADPSVGLVTTLAVILHEVPQEIGDFGVLLHGGLSVGKAVLANFLSATAAILGALLVLWIGTEVHGLEAALLTVSAASFIYIAAADLIPELHRSREPRQALPQVLMIGLGLGLMVLVHVLREGLG
ncbi:MAG: ZIP family metal transporter [Gemmatimonadales bacterium]